MNSRISNLLVVALLAGCTTIGNRVPPTDWPKLKTQVAFKSFTDTQRLCGGNLMFQYAGCASIDFCPKECNVVLWLESARNHEEQHCAGFDHHGETTARDLWEGFKARGGYDNCFRHWSEG